MSRQKGTGQQNREGIGSMTGAPGAIKRTGPLESDTLKVKASIGDASFKSLVEGISDLVMLMKTDGTIAYAGPSLKRILGYTSRECINRSFFDLLHPKDKPRVIDRIDQSAGNPDHTLSLDVDLRTKEGSWRTLEIAWKSLLHGDEPGGVVIIGRDATERRRVEERLRKTNDELRARLDERTMELTKAHERLEEVLGAHREAEAERARLATAIEQGGECVIITDQGGRIQYANPAFERASLYAREEITGLKFSVLKGDREDVFWDDIANAMEYGTNWSGRITNTRKDGSTYEVERTISPIRDNEGYITNFVAVERDMTEQEGLEAELRQAQKMQAIGTLAGGIAHDFNNILAAMIGFTELAIDDVENNAHATRHLEQVRKAGYRGRELVKQILTFSRQAEQEKKPVQVAPIVREVVKLMRASLPSSVDIKQRIETEDGIILADPVQIHQLLINLCTNAGQAMKSGVGTLEVRLSDFILDAEDEPPHPDMEPGLYVKLSVSDTGPGIDDLIKNRIFEPFFTTRQTESGGMGLSVVYGIVKSHNGAITVSSAPGRGSTFATYFRRIDQMAATVEKAKPARALKGKGRILFVDDEEALVEIARQMLERLGYEVIAEKDSIRALKQFQRNPENFDLVITDQTMPNMTGIELAKKLMSIKKDIPIILCTGFSEIISPEAAKAMGIREFVMKPIIKKEMAETIKRVIDTGYGVKK